MIQTYSQMSNTEFKTDTISATLRAQNHITSGGGCEALIAEKRRRYIVRRLTPLECSRLQGFPDGYADTSILEDMTEEETQFWEDVRKTYAEVMGKTYKPCKDKQALLKWYNGLHTDSSEYKMWGNGMCYYNMYHVIQGIVNHEKNI